MQAAGYNSLHLMLNWKRQTLTGALVVLICLTPLAAATWDQPCADLAREIASVTGPGAVALSLRNASSISADDAAAIRLSLEAQLRAAGVRVTGANVGSPEVAITLSENLEGYLWVASIRQASGTRVVMRAVARPQNVASRSQLSTVILRRALLWSQPQPMLDAAVVEADTPTTRLVILEPERVSTYRLNAGRWEPDQVLAVTHVHPFPRDVRGRLVPARGHLFDAYLPGVVCSATATAPLAMVCRESDDPWPLPAISPQAAFFGPARNFFTGVLAPGLPGESSTSPFYSAASLAGGTLWAFTGVDGRVRVWDGTNDQTLNAAHEWGSDIAAVKSACGNLLLTEANGDDSVSDTVRAYDIATRDPIPASQPLEFPGPLTALWSPAESSTATAITRNLQTRMYEAYTIAVSCP